MKKFEGFEQIGFIIDGKHHESHGTIGGYRYFVTEQPERKQYTVVTTVKKDEETGDLQNYLNAMDKGMFIQYAGYNQYVLILNIKNDKNLTVWEFDRILKELSSQLQTLGYRQCCRHCGQEVNVNVCSVQGQVDLICDNCFSGYEVTVPDKKPINFPLGIVGALIGSLIGVFAWVIIYQLGIVAGITGFIMAWGCFKGYELLGGRLDKKGIIVSIVIAIVMLAIAEAICLSIEIYSYYSNYYILSAMDIIESLPFFLSDSEIFGAVVGDMLFGYGFMALASFAFIKNKYKEASFANVVEKLG